MTKYEVVQDRNDSNAFRAEAFGPDGECYVTIFYGPQAKERADEYAQFKNGASAN